MSQLRSVATVCIESIEKARIHLEEFNLLDTYVQETDQKNRYIYSLKAPLDEEGFLASKDMLSIYLNAVGKKQLELNLGRMGNYKISTNDYRKITRIVNHTSNTNTYDATVEYSKLKPRYEFSDDEVQINFDYEHFFATTSTLVFPAELRSEENLRLIGKLATVYGLSADKMRLLVTRIMDLSMLSLHIAMVIIRFGIRQNMKTQPEHAVMGISICFA